MRLTFVRHGQTPSNVAGVLESAVPGPALTPEGWSQATTLADAIAGDRVDAIYASTQLRALQTAGTIAARTGRPLYVRHGLREVECGDYELRADAVALDGYWDAIAAWAAGDLGRVIPGAESGPELFERLDAVIGEVAASGHESVVIVSHGGSIRGWTAARVRNGPENFIAGYPLHNTGIVEVEGDSAGGWDLLSWMGEPMDLAAERSA